MGNFDGAHGEQRTARTDVPLDRDSRSDTRQFTQLPRTSLRGRAAARVFVIKKRNNGQCPATQQDDEL